MRVTFPRVLLVLVVVAVVLLPAPVLSKSAGMTGRTDTGCTCHSSSESSTIEPAINGLPDAYELGAVYDLEIRYTGGDIEGGNAIAGFNLFVEAGTLSVPDGSNSVRVDGSSREATHTSNGAMNNVWSVIWTAPDSPKGNIDVVLVVNDVNGDGSAGPADQWGRVEYTVDGDPDPVTIVLTVVAVIAVVAVVAFLFVTRSRRKRKATGPRPADKSGKNRRRRNVD